MTALARVLTDTHAHLSYIRDRVGQRAIDSIVEAYSGGDAFILDVGVEPDDLPGRLRDFGRFGFVKFAAGVWPSRDALSDPAAALAALERHASDPRCAAVGEGGLDYHHMNGSVEAQKRLFEGQIDLAKRLGKPLLVHSRDAFDDTLALVASAASAVPVVIHCFGYGPEEAKAFLDAGCYVSFAGNLTYPKALGLREAVRLVPPDRLLLETDAPYMNPVPFRGKPSTPLDVGRTYAEAAALRGDDPAGLIAAVSATARRLLDPEPRS